MWRTIFDPANYVMTPVALPPLVVGALTMAMGWAVLIRERGSFVSIAFWLVTVVGGLWLESYVGIYTAREAAVALWWGRVEKVAVVFIPTAVYLFTLAVVQRVPQYRKWVWWSAVCSAGFALGVVWTDWLVAGLHRYPWGVFVRYGWLSAPFLLFFFLLMVASFRLYRRAIAGCRSVTHRRRLREFFLAFCIAYLGSVDYLPAFGVPVYPVGYLPVFAFLLVAAHAIWRYRLVDITPAFAARQILATMVDAVLVVDGEGVIRVANEAACRAFERATDELVGQPLAILDPSLFGSHDVHDVLSTGVAAQYETVYPTRSRGRLVLDVTLSAVPDHTGRPIGVMCLARDLTERKRAEQVIQESRTYAEQIVNTVREPLVVLDDHLRIRSANQAFYQAFQVSPEEARNRPIDEVGKGQWNLSKLRGMLAILPKEQPFQDIEMEYEFPEAGCRTLLLNARRLSRAGSPTDLILLAMEDITDRKRAEAQLKQALEALDAARVALAASRPAAGPSAHAA